MLQLDSNLLSPSSLNYKRMFQMDGYQEAGAGGVARVRLGRDGGGSDRKVVVICA